MFGQYCFPVSGVFLAYVGCIAWAVFVFMAVAIFEQRKIIKEHRKQEKKEEILETENA
jgi:hypothetical protein